MEFGKSLKEQRSKLGLTQQEVAQKLYVTRQTISSWENGKSYPDLNMLIKIGDVYQISIDNLLKGDQALKNSLDRNKVETILSPLNVLSSLLSVSTLILCLYADSLWMKYVTMGICVVNSLLDLIIVRMTLYTSDTKLANYKKLFIYIALAVLAVFLVVFFGFAKKNLDTAIVVLMVVLVAVSLILSLISYVLEMKIYKK